jgi:hypothetical protein
LAGLDADGESSIGFEPSGETRVGRVLRLGRAARDARLKQRGVVCCALLWLCAPGRQWVPVDRYMMPGPTIAPFGESLAERGLGHVIRTRWSKPRRSVFALFGDAYRAESQF